MFIKKLKLSSFRNYRNVEVDFNPGLNIFVGKNGQGKTNLLESIYFLSTTKSHRRANDLQMLQYGEEFFEIDCTGENENGPISYAAIIHKKGKNFILRGEAIKKMSDYVGKLNVVIFSPLDMNLFDASPTERRRFMDIELGKMSKIYITYLNRYSQLLKSRNAALKEEPVNEMLVDTIAEQMLQPQVEIIRYRHQFIEQLNKYITEFYQKISETDSKVNIEYESMVVYHSDQKVLEGLIASKQKHTRDRDFILKQTNSGIQREDIEFYLDSHPVRIHASQGQKRMIIIALKLSLVKIIHEKIGEYPVLLLDDVLSELDEDRRNALINLLPEGVQTIITATEKEAIDERLLSKAKIMQIEKGSIVNG